uniref:Uncharacterized protein n=1 Tax=Rhizophora mucronata TaxID=61149 RepID=A0A2P2PGV9_RHIMU
MTCVSMKMLQLSLHGGLPTARHSGLSPHSPLPRLAVVSDELRHAVTAWHMRFSFFNTLHLVLVNRARW